MSSSRSTKSTEKQTIKCYCPLPTKVMISWTPTNPGRRSVSCKFYNPNTGFRGCKFFRWIDEGTTDWQRDVINELKAEKSTLMSELNLLRSRISQLDYERATLLAEVEGSMGNSSNMNYDVKYGEIVRVNGGIIASY